jgi:amidase
MLFSGVEGQAQAVATGEVSAVELVEAVLERIDRVDPLLNAFTVVLSDEARTEAARRDEARTRGEELGPLHGVPVAIKEELDVAGCVTTFGGRGNSTPARSDSEVVRRLRAAGAAVVGKTAMPEFGAWPYTESEAHGITHNPWSTRHTPGGSSGGTAAAVAAGMVPVGLGGDGGGSIRIPSAFCGLFGLKPQRGRVTAAPMEHLWWSLGTIGPLARSVLDSALVYDAIRGSHDTDLFRAADTGSFVDAARKEPGRLRIGWSTRPVSVGVKPDRAHVTAVEDTAVVLEELGHEVFEIDPRYPDATTAFIPQIVDGVRAEARMVEHPDRLERRTRQVLRIGSPVRPRLADGAVRRGERLADRVDERVFSRCDVLLTPTLAVRPARIGILDGASAVKAALKSQPMIAYTSLWNVTGHPAASVPSGFAEDGLPTAVQLVAPRGDEVTMFGLSAQMESVRPWAQRTPKL